VLAGVKGFKDVPASWAIWWSSRKRPSSRVRVSHHRAYEAAIRLIDAGRVPLLERMHTHEFALDAAAEAIGPSRGERPGATASTPAWCRDGVSAAHPHPAAPRRPYRWLAAATCARSSAHLDNVAQLRSSSARS
jgi:hypothetical protein